MASSKQIEVCDASDLGPGERKLVEHDGREIGVYNIGGDYFALRNYCPHAAAPLCVGKVGGVIYSSKPHTYEYDPDTVIVTCPWHHWEFRIDDGTCLTDERAKVRTYDVSVEQGKVTVHI